MKALHKLTVLGFTFITCLGVTSVSQASPPWEKYISQASLEKLSDSEKKGLEIAIKEDINDMGWKNSESNMRMIIRSKSGSESIREVVVKSLEIEGDGDKSLSVFKTPRDLNGTAFLSYSHITGPDEQWIYLASLKRVKRINSNNKSGPYIGSEFAYEDLSSFEVNKYDYNYLRDESLEGVDCYVVERTPRDENSGYTKIVSWISKDTLRRHKVDFYDRKGQLLKTLIRTDFEQFLDRYWRAKTLTMTNHQSGKSTILKYDQLKFDIGLSESDFSLQQLRRTR